MHFILEDSDMCFQIQVLQRGKKESSTYVPQKSSSYNKVDK